MRLRNSVVMCKVCIKLKLLQLERGEIRELQQDKDNKQNFFKNSLFKNSATYYNTTFTLVHKIIIIIIQHISMPLAKTTVLNPKQ